MVGRTIDKFVDLSLRCLCGGQYYVSLQPGCVSSLMSRLLMLLLLVMRLASAQELRLLAFRVSRRLREHWAVVYRQAAGWGLASELGGGGVIHGGSSVWRHLCVRDLGLEHCCAIDGALLGHATLLQRLSIYRITVFLNDSEKQFTIIYGRFCLPTTFDAWLI